MPSDADLYSIYEIDPAPIVEFLGWLSLSYDLAGELAVLDMGCGPGRLLQPIAELGWSVTGMEPDGAYRDAASRSGSEQSQVNVVEGGFADLAAESEYDMIVAVNDPFSYLLTPAQRADALQRCFKALRSGGVLFLDVPNFHWILKNYRTPREITLEIQGCSVVRRPKHDLDFNDAIWTHTDDFEIASADGITHRSKTHRLAMVGFPELAAALTDAGFQDLRTYNSFAARETERLAGARIMVSAHRP